MVLITSDIETMTRRKGIGGHSLQGKGRSEDWITPKYFIESLGPFDLDPCASLTQPWPCATAQYTINDNGLMLPWEGIVWLNPPYGPYVERWIEKLALHGNGIALTFARTETKMFSRLIWDLANSGLFLKGRVRFFRSDGSAGPHTAGAPSVLVAYGEEADKRLKDCDLQGKYLRLR